MAGKSGGAKRLVLLTWVLVAFFYFYLSYDYISAKMHDQQFDDYIHYVVQIAVNEHRPMKDVKSLLLVKAEELSIPVHGDDITITGGAGTLTVAVSYNVEIEIPLIQHEIYTQKFEHNVKYQGVR